MINSIGAVCFGIVIGYVTYRTLVRTTKSSISDIAAVVAAVGGGAITSTFDPAEGHAFAWYAIGLLGGMILFLVLRLRFERPGSDGKRMPTVLGDPTPPRTLGG